MVRPYRPIATDHRKGAMKAALELREEAAEGELEPALRGRARPPTPPVEATTVRDLAAKLAEKAMRALEEDMDYGEPRERQEAARTLAVVCAKLMGDEPEKPPELTPEEREAQLRAAMQTPEVRAFLEREGWMKTGEEPGKEGA